MARKTREVVLSFAMKNLLAAEKAARAVIASVSKSKTLIGETKRELLKTAREQLKEVRALKESTLQRERLDKRARELRAGKGDDRLGALTSRLRAARKDVREFFGNPLRDLASGDATSAALGLASELGGPFVKILSALVVQQIAAYVDERIQQQVELRSQQFTAQLEELRYQANYQKRLEDEPAFRRREAQRTYAEVKAEESWLSEHGMSRSGDLLDCF